MSATEAKLEDGVKEINAIIITVADALNSEMALQRLAAASLRTDMMVRIFKVLEEMEPIQKAIMKRRDEALGNHASQSIPDQWTFKGESPEDQLRSRQAFDKEWNEVLEEKHSPAIKPIKFAELRAAVIGDFPLTAGDLRSLKWLIVEVG